MTASSLGARARRASRPFLACLAVTAATWAGSARAATHLFLAADQADVRFFGSSSGDRLGRQLAAADVDGDGLADLVAGSEVDLAGTSNRNAIHVFLGRSTWAGQLDLGAADVTIRGPADGAYLQLAGVTDLDGDGVADLVAHSRTFADNALHVLLGRTSWPAEWDLATRPADVTIRGGRELGAASAASGDLDGDGRTDLLVLGEGTQDLRILLGRDGWPPDLTLDEATSARILGLRSAAWPPAVADVDGDGIEDIAVMAGSDDAGVLLGRRTWPEQLVVGWGQLDVNVATAGSGRSIAGDVTGDGIADWILSDRPGSGQRGRVRVLPGGAGLASASPVLTIYGADRYDRLRALAVADWDADGRGDVVLHAKGDGSRNRQLSAGEISIVSGTAGPVVDLAVDQAMLTLFGDATHDVGSAGLSLGDLDGDGRADLVASAPSASGPDGSGAAGVVHAVFGRDRAATPAAPDLHVDAALGDDAADGMSWQTSLATVGEALDRLDETVGPATVRVADGTYPGSVMIGAATTLLGGHDSASGERALHAATSVLDGTAAWGSVVQFAAAPEGQEARLDGFTVTGGRAEVGAGIRISSGRPLITNNVITGNTAVAEEWTYPVTCYDPITQTSYWVDVCSRSCVGLGTGVHVDATASADLVNNLIVGNDVDVVWSPWCTGFPGPNCNFFPFDCPDFGAGGGVSADGTFTLIGNTIAANDGDGLRLLGGGGSLIEGNVLHGNTGIDLYGGNRAAIRSNVYGSSLFAEPDETNREADPLFVDPAQGDFRLSQVAAGQAADSPALDLGSVPAESVCLAPGELPCLDGYSTRSDGRTDEGAVDAGRHEPVPNQPPVFGGLVSVEAAGDCGVALSWVPARDREGDEPVVYRVYRAETPGGQDFDAPLATADGDSWIDTDGRWGVTYHYVVRAVDARGAEGSGTVELAAAPEDSAPPAPPSLQLIGRSACQVRLAVSSGDACSGLARIELHRSAEAGFVPDPSTLVLADAPPEPTDTVTANGFVHYRAIAIDRSGRSRISSSLSVRVAECTADAVPPGPARIRSVTLAPDGLELVVEPAEGAVFHRLRRGHLLSLRSGHDHAVGGEIGACRFDGEAVVDAGVRDPGSFYYLVTGVNAAGEGTPGTDSAGRATRDETSGVTDCP